MIGAQLLSEFLLTSGARSTKQMPAPQTNQALAAFQRVSLLTGDEQLEGMA